MKLKIILFFIGLLTTSNVSPDLATIRKMYREASNSEEITKKLYDSLTSIGKNDKTTLVAYKGAVTTLMAKYAEDIKNKKIFFKEGKELLEYSVTKEPKNAEIRCIRLSVQENAPKITGYRKNIEEDKRFILDNCALMTNEAAKNFVRAYASQSDTFDASEKQLLQGG